MTVQMRITTMQVEGNTVYVRVTFIEKEQAYLQGIEEALREGRVPYTCHYGPQGGVIQVIRNRYEDDWNWLIDEQVSYYIQHDDEDEPVNVAYSIETDQVARNYYLRALDEE